LSNILGVIDTLYLIATTVHNVLDIHFPALEIGIRTRNISRANCVSMSIIRPQRVDLNHRLAVLYEDRNLQASRLLPLGLQGGTFFFGRCGIGVVLGGGLAGGDQIARS
jgi:hypothetical protein